MTFSIYDVTVFNETPLELIKRVRRRIGKANTVIATIFSILVTLEQVNSVIDRAHRVLLGIIVGVNVASSQMNRERKY